MRSSPRLAAVVEWAVQCLVQTRDGRRLLRTPGHGVSTCPAPLTEEQHPLASRRVSLNYSLLRWHPLYLRKQCCVCHVDRVRPWLSGRVGSLSVWGWSEPPPSPLSLWVSVIVMCQWGQHRYTPACSSQPELASLYTTQSGREEADKPCCLITAWLKVDRVWVWDMYCLHWQTKWEVWIVKLLRYFPSVE